MARYDRYGALDDQISEELDSGFVGFNNKVRPDQLSPGILNESNNGRMDLNGQWQPRKGIELFAAPFPAAVFTVPFYLYESIPSVSYYTRIGDVITVNFSSSHGIINGTGVNISGLSYTGIINPNGNFAANVIDADSISYTVSSLDSAPTGTMTVTGMKIKDTATSNIEASCEYSDPNNDSLSYIACAATNSAALVKTSDQTTIALAYPAGESVPEGSTMIQVFNKLYIFRKGQIALEWDGDVGGSLQFTLVANGDYDQPVHYVTSDGEFKITDSVASVIAEHNLIEGNNLFVVDPSTSAQTSGLKQNANFTVYKTYSQGSLVSISAASASTVSGGDYNGMYKVTITTSTDHGLSLTDPIAIAGFSDTKIDGNRFVTEIISSTQFTVHISQNPSTTITGDETVRVAEGFSFIIEPEGLDSHITDGESLLANPIFSAVPSVGAGFIHSPAPQFGVYHQRRLVVPYEFDVIGTSGSATINSRGIVDEAIFSDILDADTYDRIYGQFRFNAGKSDFIVGFHSFSDDQLIVFNRNSIHLVANSFNLTDATSKLITGEIGCVSRDTIVQVADTMLFLSDNGVYGLNFQDLYNLRGKDIPLSASIEGTIQRINKQYSHKAKSVYFDNRYYLAVPLDDSSTNNALLIYNFVNQQWESVDSIEDPAWEFTHLVVGGRDNVRGVYAINRFGGVHRIEYRNDDIDRYVVQIGQPQVQSNVVSSVVSRMFTLNTIDRKKWNNFEVHLESSQNNISDGNLEAITENIDDIIDLGSISDINGVEIPIAEDVSLRGRFGNRRAYGLQFKMTTTKGRPKLRALKVAGATTFRSLQKAE